MRSFGVGVNSPGQTRMKAHRRHRYRQFRRRFGDISAQGTGAGRELAASGTPLQMFAETARGVRFEPAEGV